MELKSEVLAGKDFLLRSLRPDHWEKFVLPGIMTLLLLAGAFSTVSLQDGYGKETLNITLESLTERQILAVQEQRFPDSLDRPFEEMRNEITSERIDERNDLRSRPLFPVKGWLSRLVFDSGAFLMIPDRDLAPWGPEEEYVKTVSLLRHRTAQIQDLGDKAAVSASYSYEDFQRDVEEIRSKSWRSDEVQQFVENRSEEASLNLGFLGDTSLEQVKEDGISDTGLLDFLPSLLITFIFYYLIGAVSVQGNIELVNRMKNQDNAIMDEPVSKQ